VSRRTIAAAAFVAFAIFAAWLLFVALPHRYAARPRQSASAPAAAPPAAATVPAGARKIAATLFYVGDDGMSLVETQRDVPYGATAVDQARAILEVQIAAAPPLVSAIPADTKVRNVFITDHGDAFVDFSGDLAAKHTGGSTDEVLTVYTIVDALTANLPAIARVQILIDGKQVDTLAGHVDLRHPLAKSLAWVAHDTH
jgi:spore germination protein GerM